MALGSKVSYITYLVYDISTGQCLVFILMGFDFKWL